MTPPRTHKRPRRARLGLRHPTKPWTESPATPARNWTPETNWPTVIAYIRNTYGEDAATRILQYVATESTGTPPGAPPPTVTYTPPDDNQYDGHGRHCYIPLDYYDSGHHHTGGNPTDPGTGPLPRDPITGQLRKSPP